jgi:hypothetical protein
MENITAYTMSQGISISRAARETTALLRERGVPDAGGVKFVLSWCRRNGIEPFDTGLGNGWSKLLPAGVPARIAAEFDRDIANARRGGSK